MWDTRARKRQEITARNPAEDEASGSISVCVSLSGSVQKVCLFGRYHFVAKIQTKKKKNRPSLTHLQFLFIICIENKHRLYFSEKGPVLSS